MHVGIANPRWRVKRSRHSRHHRQDGFYPYRSPKTQQRNQHTTSVALPEEYTKTCVQVDWNTISNCFILSIMCTDFITGGAPHAGAQIVHIVSFCTPVALVALACTLVDNIASLFVSFPMCSIALPCIAYTWHVQHRSHRRGRRCYLPKTGCVVFVHFSFLFFNFSQTFSLNVALIKLRYNRLAPEIFNANVKPEFKNNLHFNRNHFSVET